jgi:hypothetical protein
MLNLCGIVAAILKMATGRNCSMSGIYSGHHNLPTYEMSLKSDNVEFVWYCGGHFDNGDSWKFFQCQESIQGIIIYPHIKFDDIGQYLIFAAIFKMATARNFSLSGIYSGHHSLPTYEMSLKSDNVRDSKSKLFLEYLFKI